MESARAAPASRPAHPAGTATPTPKPSPVVVRVPGNQQDAQDGVDRYLQQTLDALPEGTTLDGTRHVDGPGAVGCDDATVRVQDSRDVDAPSGTDYARLVAAAADLWRQWGWTVDRTDDRGRPDDVGHTPDGYILRIEAGEDPAQRPDLTGSSPCFPSGLRQHDIPRTPVLEQSPP